MNILAGNHGKKYSYKKIYEKKSFMHSAEISLANRTDFFN